MKADWSDKELIAQCVAGKNSGYTRLYERYATPVFNSIFRLVSNVAEAEDLLQEVFITVFSQPRQLEALENFEGWTRRIAINKSISHLRKRRFFFTDIDRLQEEDIQQEQEDTSWEQSRVEDIQQAIESLPATAKTIVNLFLFEEMSQEEIGTLLGMSHTAVRSQYHRAKNKIAQKIKEKRCYGRR